MREFVIGEMERFVCFQGWLCACVSVSLDIHILLSHIPANQEVFCFNLCKLFLPAWMSVYQIYAVSSKAKRGHDIPESGVTASFVTTCEC